MQSFFLVGWTSSPVQNSQSLEQEASSTCSDQNSPTCAASTHHLAHDGSQEITSSSSTSALNVAAMTEGILAYLRYKRIGYQQYLDKLMAVDAQNYYSISWLDGECGRIKRIIGAIGILEHQCTEQSVTRMFQPRKPNLPQVIHDDDTAFLGQPGLDTLAIGQVS